MANSLKTNLDRKSEYAYGFFFFSYTFYNHHFAKIKKKKVKVKCLYPLYLLISLQGNSDS